MALGTRKVKMKKSRSDRDRLHEMRLNTARGFLGAGIKSCRERAGLSIDEAAKQSGLERTDWEAIEAGKPFETDRPTVDAIASTLKLGPEGLAPLMVFCRLLIHDRD
jgi:DNA-binding XRE family transcriptional regulator